MSADKPRFVLRAYTYLGVAGWRLKGPRTDTFFEQETAARRTIARLRENPAYEISMTDFAVTQPTSFHVEQGEDHWFVIGILGDETPRGVPGNRFIAAVADTKAEALAELARLMPAADTHFPNGTVDHGATVAS